MYRNIIGIFLFSFISIWSQAQTASIVFKGTIDFQVSINLIKQHSTFEKNIKVNNLKGDQPYNVKINFKADTLFTQSNIYLIDDGLTHIYTVTKEKVTLKKIVPNPAHPKDEQQLLVNYILNNNSPIDSIVTDTLITDTTYKIPFASYYKLEDYEGRLGCPYPMKDDEKNKLRASIIAEYLEESKLEKVKLEIEDMDSACVLVDQIKELIVLFKFEETRLNFATYMFPHTFDIDNYERLYSTFNYENSRAQLKELLKK